VSLPSDGAHRGARLVERRQGNVVRVGKCLLFARDCADTDAAIDTERSRLDDPLFERPALVAGMLEVQVSKIDVVLMDGREHAFELGCIEIGRSEQRPLGDLGDGRRMGWSGSEHIDQCGCCG